MASLNLTPPKLGVLGFFEGIDFEARQRATAADIQLKQSQRRIYDINTRYQQMTLQSRADAIANENLSARQKYEQSAALFPSQQALASSEVAQAGQDIVLKNLEIQLAQSRNPLEIKQLEAEINRINAVAGLRKRQGVGALGATSGGFGSDSATGDDGLTPTDTTANGKLKIDLNKLKTTTTSDVVGKRFIPKIKSDDGFGRKVVQDIRGGLTGITAGIAGGLVDDGRESIYSTEDQLRAWSLTPEQQKRLKVTSEMDLRKYQSLFGG